MNKTECATVNAGNLQGGRFRPGVSGNPRGKPKGCRNRATIAAEKLLDGESEALTRKAIELAKNGDVIALRLCLGRILPERKDRPVSFELPELSCVKDASRAMSEILKAVADGDLTPTEAETMTRIIDSFIKTIETAEFEKRIIALEEAKNA
jgi:hypothetical protein